MLKASNLEPLTKTRGNEQIFSYSVNKLLQNIANTNSGAATLLHFLEALFKDHPEYGAIESEKNNLFEEVIRFLQEQKELKLNFYTSDEWIEKVNSNILGSKISKKLNGRIFLISALLDELENVQSQVDRPEEWRNICATFITKLEDDLGKEKIDFDSLLSERGRSLRRSIIQEKEKTDEDSTDHNSLINTANVTDNPVKEDALSRKPLANYIARRLDFIYHRDIKTENPHAFLVHIDGAWGSGKSTLLGFLQEALEDGVTNDKESSKKWIVVNFNAWEHQRLDVPWWFFMKVVYKDAIKVLRQRDIRKWRNVGLRETFWRFKTTGNYALIAVIAFLISAYAIYMGTFREEELSKTFIAGIISFLTFIWSTSKTITTSLISGSAKAAQAFVEENSRDPMSSLAGHFRKIIDEISYPVAIFIDDLDRCNQEYGIRLLEGLQTIYKKAPVVYVIAADRRWLSTMYENHYKDFTEIISKPAKPFGLVFLDKIFQLVIELPEISVENKRAYWSKLLKNSEPLSDEEKNQFKKQVANEKNLKEKLDILNKVDHYRTKQYIREQIVNSLSVRKDEQIIQHKLENFVDLIEPNPRAMKRLINDITTLKAMTILYGQRVKEEQLVLWSILKQQYPDLADYLWEDPEIMEEISSGSIDNEVYKNLLNKKEVRQLFAYQVGNEIVKLDKDFLQKMKFQ